MTTRQLKAWRKRLQRIYAIAATMDPDPADAIGGRLYSPLSRISSDADEAIQLIDAVLATIPNPTTEA